MDQTIRNRLRNVVTQCRKLLEDSTAQALQGRFGIYAARKKGEVHIEDEARMAHLTEEDRACRQDLLDHLEHIQAIGYKPSEALEQLVREISFTHLNRLCAYKMMESRGLIREAVSRGLKSQGFFFYLADHPEDEKLHNGGGQETTYRNFLDWLGGTLSQEIGVLFNPNDPANRIYPPQRVLDEVLALINDGDLKDIWSQDETIGWVYQYFTPKELRDKARKESQAPRNSYELAFRNQFFTPRYVVEFLTDNTLGRIWYEMRKGKTILKDRCKYLVRRPTEIFLKDGEQPPAESKEAREDLSQEELLKQPVYVPHRPKKDPRELKALDPACGSGHFLLYCFDLLQTIYEEAYDDPDLSAALRKDYPAIEDLRRAVPGLILKHNLHGIDIDLRATQIAALALWLRCQRAYQEMGLKNGDRPKITRSNIVCAEPMPGETDLLKEFTSTLQPKVLGQLVETVFEEMKLAGEAGSLLKIEEEIREAAGKAKFEFIQWKKHQDKAKWSLFPELVKRDQPSIFDFADMTDEMFLDRVEDEIVVALRQYAEKASNGRGFRRRLFAEDAARGFSFVDVSSKKYDVVLMNPPFGEATQRLLEYLKKSYPLSKHELAAAFIERASTVSAINGLQGAITTRSPFFLKKTARWRREFFSRYCPAIFLDLGWGVLEAKVETCAHIFGPADSHASLFYSVLDKPEKESAVDSLLERHLEPDRNAFLVDMQTLRSLPNSPLAYWIPRCISKLFITLPQFESSEDGRLVRQGIATADDFRFLRATWEIPPCLFGQSNADSQDGRGWIRLVKGGEFSEFFSDVHLLVDWLHEGRAIKDHVLSQYPYLGDNAGFVVKNTDWCFLPGFTWSDRGDELSMRFLPAGCIFSCSGPALFAEERVGVCSLWNSTLARYVMKAFVAIGDYRPEAGSPHWTVGQLKFLPYPNMGAMERSSLGKLERQAWHLRLRDTLDDETIAFYLAPFDANVGNGSLSDMAEACFRDRKQAATRITEIKQRIDELVFEIYRIPPSEQAKLKEAGPGYDKGNDLGFSLQTVVNNCVRNVVSWGVGVILGRWDIRLATGERQPQELPDPFDPLPVCPPGMLQGPDGLPAKPEDVPSNYPIRIDWDGILVDDLGHEDDIIRRVQNVLEVIWKDRAEAIEREACEILGVRELRDYFRKPGNGGFWMDHVKRYSKSRRKAPIYWYLRSAKGNYGLWLYYHRLDKDILFKALLNYVEPKVRLEEDRLKSLRGRKETAGSSGREAKQIEKDMDRQEQFVSELHDFADKLRRAANLHLIPDLNDGVVLTIAPLFELVPWKEAKECWEDLVEGKYEWSSIGKQMREKGLVKK